MLSKLVNDMTYTIKMMRDLERLQNQGSVFYQPKRSQIIKKKRRAKKNKR